MNKVQLMLGLILFISVFSCKKKDLNLDQTTIEQDVSPSFGVPIGYAELNLGDFEQQFDGDGLVYNESDKIFELVYEKKAFEFSPGDYLSFATQAFNASFPFPGFGGMGSVSYTEQVQQSLVLSNGEEIDSIEINNGSLTLTLSNNLDHPVEVTISSEYIKSPAGVNLQSTLNVPANTGGETAVIDLVGYTIDFSKNGTTSNEINMTAAITVTNSGSANESGDVGLNFNVELNDFKTAWGYFGQNVSNVETEVNLVSFYSAFNGGVLHFAEPRLEFKVFNTAGLSVGNELTAIYEAENNSNTLTGAGWENIPDILAANQIGDTAVVSHVINNGNTGGSLSTMLDATPANITFAVQTTSNPGGVTQNFITRESKVWANVKAVLPFVGYANNFSFSDTTKVDLANSLEIAPEDNITVEDIKKATFRIRATNGMPLDARLQVYFADSLGVVKDSLFGGPDQINGANLLVGGTLGTDGKVVSETVSITNVERTGAQLQKLVDEKVTKVIYKAYGNTSPDGNTNVQMYPEYNFKIELGAKLDLKLNLQQ